VNEGDDLSVFVLLLQDFLPTGGRHVVLCHQVHGSLLRVGVVPELDNAFAERTLLQLGVRDDVPA